MLDFAKRNKFILSLVAVGYVVGAFLYIRKKGGYGGKSDEMTPMDKCMSERMRAWEESGRQGAPPEAHCNAERTALGEEKFNAKYGY